MKRLFFFGISFFITTVAMACEFCGCSTGNYFIGPLPQFRNYFVGTRYTVRSFTTSVTGDPGQFSKDFYQTAELWGGVNLGKRWQLLGFLPYNINRQHSDDGLRISRGLGDATLLANYRLVNPGTARISHQLWIGGGLKLPTGTYIVDPDDLNASANNQPGTGSLDVVANALYVMRIDNWSINANINYRVNQAAKGFQFGNRLATSAFVFRSFPTTSVTLNPGVGLLHEDLAANRQDNIKVESTGGHGLLAAAGLDTNFKKFTVGFNVQLPMTQNYSAGQTKTVVRGMAHLTFTF